MGQIGFGCRRNRWCEWSGILSAYGEIRKLAHQINDDFKYPPNEIRFHSDEGTYNTHNTNILFDRDFYSVKVAFFFFITRLRFIMVNRIFSIHSVIIRWIFFTTGIRTNSNSNKEHANNFFFLLKHTKQKSIKRYWRNSAIDGTFDYIPKINHCTSTLYFSTFFFHFLFCYYNYN